MLDSRGERLLFHGLPVVELAEAPEIGDEPQFVVKKELEFLEVVKSSHGGAFLFYFQTPEAEFYFSPAPGLGWFAFRKNKEVTKISYETSF